MGVLRNFINVEGICPENLLPGKLHGEIVEYSEVDYIFVPEDKPKIKNIYEVVVGVECKNTRVINARGEKIVVIDGVKKFKIMCSEKSETNKAVILDVESPFNTFFEIPKGFDGFENIKIYIADAYFQLIDGRKIYSNLLYMIEIGLKNNKDITEPVSNIDSGDNENINSQGDDEEFPDTEIYNEFL